MKTSGISLSVLRDTLSYDQNTGIFRWIESPSKSVPAGSRAGSIAHGRRVISVLGERLADHRLAWFYHYGKWPVANICHKNGDLLDCRIENLVEKTSREIALGAGMRSNNKSGFRGVSWCSKKEKWQATITVNGKQTHMGYFDNINDAAEAYKIASTDMVWSDGNNMTAEQRKRRWRLILWKKVFKKYGKNTGWNSAEHFYESVGYLDSVNVMAYPMDPNKMIGPDNFRIGPKEIIDISAYERRKMDPDRFRNYALRQSFGITLDEYEKMFASQGGVCAICAEPETAICNGKVKALAVDHCHDTGKIRGLCCAACNQALGKFKDSTRVLRNAIAYLEKYSTP